MYIDRKTLNQARVVCESVLIFRLFVIRDSFIRDSFIRDSFIRLFVIHVLAMCKTSAEGK